MRRLTTFAVLLSALGLLAACQPSLSGKAAQGVTPNAVTGGEIETTALDAPPGEVDPKTPAPEVAAGGTDVAAAQTDPEATPVADKSEDAAEGVVEATEPAPKPDLTDIPVTPKSEKQLACEKKKGRWAKVGKGDARACVFQTKDSGKRCERESQCDSVCLARSGTCAPFKPMYGCNEILQDNGARVTLCLD
jgi:hypothetical protein